MKYREDRYFIDNGNLCEIIWGKTFVYFTVNFLEEIRSQKVPFEEGKVGTSEEIRVY